MHLFSFQVYFHPFYAHNYSDYVLGSERCQHVGDVHSSTVPELILSGH